MKRDLSTPASKKPRPGLCVFCGSSHGLDPAYTEITRQFGMGLAEAGFDLVFGGGGIGLMGELAVAVKNGGGKVTGVIPAFLRHLEPPLGISSELLVTNTMSERKVRMFELSEAFAILPGGLGTMDEFFEALTYAQLDVHGKPIVILNAKGFFTPLLGFIDHMIAQGFVREENRNLYKVAQTPEEALSFLRATVKA